MVFFSLLPRSYVSAEGRVTDKMVSWTYTGATKKSLRERAAGSTAGGVSVIPVPWVVGSEEEVAAAVEVAEEMTTATSSAVTNL